MSEITLKVSFSYNVKEVGRIPTISALEIEYFSISLFKKNSSSQVVLKSSPVKVIWSWSKVPRMNRVLKVIAFRYEYPEWRKW